MYVTYIQIILDNAVNELYMRTNCLIFHYLSVAHYLIYLTRTLYIFMVVHYGNIMTKIYKKYFMLHGENHCIGFGRFQMLQIITYCLS